MMYIIFVHWPQNIRRQDKKDLFSILYRCSPFVTCARDEADASIDYDDPCACMTSEKTKTKTR